ncbi:autotransporter-associated beta strand repeat-containing protein [bacterium]|nr:autotransporter-associated beta strand repeat-containing protein [bacterium]
MTRNRRQVSRLVCLLLACGGLCCLYAPGIPPACAQTTNYWRAEATDGYWNVDGNWWNGVATQKPLGSEVIRFDNNIQLAMTNDLPSTGRFWLFFDSSATSSRLIYGATTNTFYDYGGTAPKIENDSTAEHFLYFPIVLGYSTMEINPVNGDLTVGSIDLGANTLQVYGNNVDGAGKMLTLSGDVFGTGALVVRQDAKVKVTGAATYTGNTEIDRGEFWIGSGGSITNASTIYVGNGGAASSTAKLWIEDGSTTVSNNLVVNAGDVGRRVIGGLNSSGTALYTASLTLNGPVDLEASQAGGTVEFAGIISGAGSNSITGPGRVRFGSTNLYTGITLIDNGVLELAIASGDALNTSEIKLGAAAGADPATLALNSSDGFTVDNDLNVRGSGARALENMAGTNTIGGNVYLDADLTVTTTNGALAFTGTTFDLKNQRLTVTGVSNTLISAALGNSTGNGQLVKDGTGLLNLRGDHTYSGATTVSNGVLTLDVDATLSGTPTITVHGGALLLVTNSIAGSYRAYTNNQAVALEGGSWLSGVISSTNLIQGFGTIDGAGVDNSGRLLATNGTLWVRTTGVTNVATATIGTRSTNAVLDLQLPGAVTALVNQGTVTMAGGTLQFNGNDSGTITNTSTGTLIGVGDFTAKTVVNDGSILAANPVGALSVFSVSLDDLSSATATLGASTNATLNLVVSGGLGTAFANNGTVSMTGGALSISNGAPGLITNNFLVSGYGTITSTIFNQSNIIARVAGGSGTLTVNLRGGTNTSVGYLQAGQGATLVLSNGLLNLGTIGADGLAGGAVQVGLTAAGVLTNRGTIAGNNPSAPLSFRSFVRNDDGGLILATNGTLIFAAVDGLYNTAATIRVDSGGVIRSDSSNSWSNAGLIDLRGGTLRTGGSTNAGAGELFTNVAAGTISGYGTIIGGGAYGGTGLGYDKGVINVGSLVATNPSGTAAQTLYLDTGGATSNNGIHNIGSVVVASNQTLSLNRDGSLPIVNVGTVNLRHGTLTGSSGVLSNTNDGLGNVGLIVGSGTITFPLVNAAGATVRTTNGVLLFTSSATPFNEGRLQVADGATMTFNTAGPWQNTGTIDLWGGTLRTGGTAGEPFTNATGGLIVGYGTLIGGGAGGGSGPGVDKSVLNLGTIIITNPFSGTPQALVIDTGEATVNDGFRNLGTIEIASGNSLYLQRAPGLISANEGTLSILGATLFASSGLYNKPGAYLNASRGSIGISGLFSNAGQVSFVFSEGIFSNNVVNQGRWTLDPSTNTYISNYEITSDGYLEMDRGSLAVFKSNVFNYSTQSNLYNTLAGKFQFDGSGDHTQQLFVAGLNLTGSATSSMPTNEVSFSNSFGTFSTNTFTFYYYDPIWGFTNNFALGELEIGNDGTNSTLLLMDSFDDSIPAGLYLDTLTLNAGSLLIISNDVSVYFLSTNGITGVSFDPGSVGGANVLLLNGGSFHQIAVIPEPSQLMLMALGVWAVWRWHRRGRPGRQS